MKTKILLISLLNSLNLLSGYGQSDRIIKPYNLNLCVLIVDYTTYNFEGGNISYYERCDYTENLPFVIDYKSPSDIGWITFRIKTTSDIVFDASIIWNGTGEINYPEEFSNSEPFDKIYKKVSKKPTHIEYFKSNGDRITNDVFFIQKADSAWNAVSSMNIINKFSYVKYKVGIYMYAPRVGQFDPKDAKWIIFLYY